MTNQKMTLFWNGEREIDFELVEGLSVHGFVAIREKASTSEAGLHYFVEAE